MWIETKYSNNMKLINLHWVTMIDIICSELSNTVILFFSNGEVAYLSFGTAQEAQREFDFIKERVLSSSFYCKPIC